MKKIAVLLFVCMFFAGISSAQSTRPIVTNIESSMPNESGTVSITWTISNEVSSTISELLVYRNVGSIITPLILSELEPYATLSRNETNYTDVINDYKSYYYAIIARTNNGLLYDIVIPSVNATDISTTREKVQVTVLPQDVQQALEYQNASTEISASVEAPLRKRPLPYLDIIPNIDSAFQADESITSNNLDLFSPYILEEDRNGDNATGDDYTLFLIVQSVVEQENWVQSEQELLKFLQINRSSETTARANFYLGQVYYFMQDYRTSLTHLQRSEKLYPVYSKRWIEEALNRFTIY